MKIYLFNMENGVYLGEDFADEAAFSAELPPGATSIAPPPFQRREVPVFLPDENRWELTSRMLTRRS
ncbi:hypothetical protein KP001_16265 [Geomonas subterranea]|uniref:Uncharacterized protein n=1 Tax=Geomonas subterranea TaxID=2847989 RepID=A0ABX8LD45_9BACT|nr:hypothetical protein [Geomonas subterranea]QXE89960.1 hypothetical protein KP001_16265 [Geomonas subterranea]QXM07921.1 hypothetical protein KP002_13020 [Geomonas subterranea]